MIYQNVGDMEINEQIDWYARRVIVASMQYYMLNTNVISDKEYDRMAKKLYNLIQRVNGDLSNCKYGKVLENYTAATGFDLPYRLEEIDKEHYQYLVHIANLVILLNKNSKKDDSKRRIK